MTSRFFRLLTALFLCPLACALPGSASAEETATSGTVVHSAQNASPQKNTATGTDSARHNLSDDRTANPPQEDYVAPEPAATPAPAQTPATAPAQPPAQKTPTLEEMKKDLKDTFAEQNSLKNFPIYGILFMFWTWPFWAVLAVSATLAWLFLRKYRRITEHFIKGSRFEAPSQFLATPYYSYFIALSGVIVALVCLFFGAALPLFWRDSVRLLPTTPEGRLFYENLARYLPFLIVLVGGRLLVIRMRWGRGLFAGFWFAGIAAALWFAGPKGRNFFESALFFALGGIFWMSVFVILENLLAFGRRGLLRALIVLAGNFFVFLASAQLAFLVILAYLMSFFFKFAFDSFGSGSGDSTCPACGGKNGFHTSGCSKMRLDGYTHGMWGWQK
jgi:hypothetical protein